MAEGSVCKACNRGSLFRNKVRRMNGFVVFLGFLLFIPSVLGILVGTGSTIGARFLEQQAKRPPEEIRAELAGLKVPDPVIERLLTDKEDLSESMTSYGESVKGLDAAQGEAVGRAWFAQVGRILPMQTFVGVSLAILAGAIVLGVIAFLFIRRKWVLQCSDCPTTKSAARCGSWPRPAGPTAR